MAITHTTPGLPVTLAANLELSPVCIPWMINQLWSHKAVGIIGGTPKSAKTWFGLDMAISVASGSPCLDFFSVDDPGPVLIYLAEDDLSMVRKRIAGICKSRQLDIESLPLYVITASSLHLDNQVDRDNLVATITTLNPKMLLLDPLVRLHNLDENSSREISGLLGFLRDLQRWHSMAVILTHHVNKKNHGRPGQSLRGSSDLFAWVDSFIFLLRQKNEIKVSIEHRSAQAPDSFTIKLVTDDAHAHLSLVEELELPKKDQLDKIVLSVLEETGSAITRTELRRRIGVRNQSLGAALERLTAKNKICDTKLGWVLTKVKVQGDLSAP